METGISSKMCSAALSKETTQILLVVLLLLFLLLLVVVVVVVKFVVQNSLHISETLHLTNKQTNIKPLCTNDWRKWKCLKTSPVPYGRCPTEERRPKWYIYIWLSFF